jgi:hypothetical protein
MKKIALAALALDLLWMPASAKENPLTISILKTKKGSPEATYLLLSVENKSDVRFKYTKWSCVFWNGNDPVHEEEAYVENVPPHDKAIKNEIQSRP